MLGRICIQSFVLSNNIKFLWESLTANLRSIISYLFIVSEIILDYLLEKVRHVLHYPGDADTAAAPQCLVSDWVGGFR